MGIRKHGTATDQTLDPTTDPGSGQGVSGGFIREGSYDPEFAGGADGGGDPGRVTYTDEPADDSNWTRGIN